MGWSALIGLFRLPELPNIVWKIILILIALITIAVFLLGQITVGGNAVAMPTGLPQDGRPVTILQYIWAWLIAGGGG